MNIFNKIQNWTQSGPNGNDKQQQNYVETDSGNKGFWGSLLGMGTSALGGAPLGIGLGIASSLFGGMHAAKGPTTAPITPQQIQGYMAPSQALLNQYGDMAQQMMDPQSAMNRRQFQTIEQQGARQLALQQLLSNRQAASMGQASGITSAQNRMAQSGIGRQSANLYNQALMQAQQRGQGMLGQQMQMQQGMDENMAQAAIAQNQALRQQEMQRRQQTGGLLGGLGSALIGGIFGGE
jgi:hypothetical protein